MHNWIYYDSKTGNVDRFVHKLEAKTGWTIQRINEDLAISVPGHLITFTTGRGEVPDVTDMFMQQNHAFIKTVSSSGNKNWGQNYGRAADRVAALYKLPLLFKFELSGSMLDVQQYVDKIIEYHEYYEHQESNDYQKMDIA